MHLVRQALLRTLASINPPLVGGEEVTQDQLRPLRHGDMFTVGERTFRWAYPEGSPLEQPPTPGRRRSSAGRAPEKENDPGMAAGNGRLSGRAAER